MSFAAIERIIYLVCIVFNLAAIAVAGGLVLFLAIRVWIEVDEHRKRQG